jgi:DNA-binding NarL/FixJ family response regulator
MPDNVSRNSGQHYASMNSPVSQHISSRATDPRSVEHAPAPLPNPMAAPASRVVVADDNPVVRAGLTALLSGREDVQVVAEASDGRQAYDAAQQHRPDVILLDVRMPGVDGISALPHLVRLAPVLMLTYSRESEIVNEALRLGAGGYLVHGEFTADQLISAVRDVKEGKAYFSATASNTLLAQMRGGPRATGGRPLPEGLGTGHHTPQVPLAPSQAPAHGYPAQNTKPGPTGPRPAAVPAVPNPSQFPKNPSQRQSSMASSPQGQQSRCEHYGLSDREVEIMEHIASGMTNAQIAATCFVAEKTVKNHINRIFTKLHAASRGEAIAVWLGTARGGGI